MGKITKETVDTGTRVVCPCADSCDYAVPESEWKFQYVTDHFCPNGHWFRIEGKTTSDLVTYEIDSRLTTLQSLI